MITIAMRILVPASLSQPGNDICVHCLVEATINFLKFNHFVSTVSKFGAENSKNSVATRCASVHILSKIIPFRVPTDNTMYSYYSYSSYSCQ